MDSYEQIMKAIYDAIGAINKTLPPYQTLERSPDTVLIGSEKLDSLHLMDLIVGIEGNIEGSHDLLFGFASSIFSIFTGSTGSANSNPNTFE